MSAGKKAQEQPLKRKRSIHYKGKGRRQNKRPAVLTVNFCLKAKKEAYWLWKGHQIPIKDYKNLARACRDAVRKAKAQLELKMAKKVKNYKKAFFKYTNIENKHREDIG